MRRTGTKDPGFGRVDLVLVIVAPGQGAQTPGFLTPWLEDPTFASRFSWLSTVAGLDLAHYGTEADAETIRDTQIAQPLLVATGLIAALELFPHPADAFSHIGAVAGHSVGEIAAAAGARAITAEQAMVLVRERGKAMAEASAVTPTGMTAVLGGDREEVLAALDKHGLTPANDNGPGQIVAAGTMEQLQAFADQPPAKARLIPLSVAGAFHTQHMEPAVGHLAALARSVSTHDPRTPVISNRDGQIVQDGREVVARIVGQIARPVRWDLCLETMSDLGVTGILEMPPAGTLTGIAKRALHGVETFALKTPDQLDDARAFCAKHGEASVIDTTPTWMMVVSPTKGTFHRSEEAGDADRPRARRQPRRRRQPARPDRRTRSPRRPGRRVAGRGRRPGLPRPAAGAPAPRGDRLMPTITTDRGTPYSAVLGIGSYRPSLVVPNSEIVDRIDSSDEWIQQRSGIKQRRFATPEETVQVMSVAAARTAIDRAGISAAQIDCVVVATVTHLLQTPAIATAIAYELGTDQAAAFDISAACAGFCHGLALADEMVRGGGAGHVLVIGVERLSDITDVTTAVRRSSSPTARVPPSSARATPPASARWSGAPTASSST